MHAGRISTYMLLGALLGAMGATAWRQDYLPVQRWLFGAGSAMLLFSGWRLVCGQAFSIAWLERLGARMGAILAAAVTRLGRKPPQIMVRRGGLVRRYGTGLAWGLVPCGMVYGALALALLAGNAPSGALVMGAFGLGTLPNLLALSSFSGLLRAWSRGRGSGWVQGSLSWRSVQWGSAGRCCCHIRWPSTDSAWYSESRAMRGGCRGGRECHTIACIAVSRGVFPSGAWRPFQKGGRARGFGQ